MKKEKAINFLLRMIERNFEKKSISDILHALNVVNYLSNNQPDLYNVILKKINKNASTCRTPNIQTEKWIDLNEQLPNEGETVLTYNVFGNMAVECFQTSKEDKTAYFTYRREVTHWMPLPNIPKE